MYADSSNLSWHHVLLTSAGWSDDVTGIKEGIRRCFLEMLDKPTSKVKVLFITTAAISEEARLVVEKCRNELLETGIQPVNIIEYDIDDLLTPDEAMVYDVIYFTGGNTGYLLSRIKATRFEAIIWQMVCANKVYVGVSAGSIIAARDISTAMLGGMSTDISALSLINAYISVHCSPGMAAKADLPFPHITLTDDQALAINSNGYEIINS